MNQQILSPTDLYYHSGAQTGYSGNPPTNNLHPASGFLASSSAAASPTSPTNEYLPFMSSTNPVQYYPSSRPGSPLSLTTNTPMTAGNMHISASPTPLSLAVATTPGGLTGEQQQMAMIADPLDRLKYFLTTAPANWRSGDIVKRFLLGNNEQISCVYWGNLFYITGTDIVKILHYRFQLMNRPIVNSKKFEEGVFSDLRNLKAGVDATLEEPRSAFLEVLYRNGCIRTQKKQKVFYWYSVPHERLFSDALERDLKREQMSIAQNTFLNRNMMALLNGGPNSLNSLGFSTPQLGHLGFNNTPQMGHLAFNNNGGTPQMGTLYTHANVAQSCPTLQTTNNGEDLLQQFTNGNTSTSEQEASGLMQQQNQEATFFFLERKRRSITSLFGTFNAWIRLFSISQSWISVI